MIAEKVVKRPRIQILNVIEFEGLARARDVFISGNKGKDYIVAVKHLVWGL